MRSAVLEESPETEVEVINDELDAVSRALELAQPGEAIMCFCDRKREVTELILRQGCVPCDDPIRSRDMVEERLTIPA
jgi:hypothetical protein